MCDMTHLKTNRIIHRGPSISQWNFAVTRNNGNPDCWSITQKTFAFASRIRFGVHKTEWNQRDRKQEVNNNDIVRNASVTLNPFMRVIDGTQDCGGGGGINSMHSVKNKKKNLFHNQQWQPIKKKEDNAWSTRAGQT